ncbi:hypothetical protein EPD60_16695 [Flaviaesturariibacter flavus]|uniref:Uncharacterized protein n=1 Tax=Flaviaesturariibacter flavus TaxID=2502780 RepID=A0A4R1B299_9BACT|nr:hypothetical protein [Flaviaesturariibacter flavus]TCJ12182.1 hypothetical protein EPD60_16695 [Flaviaesturariibacter flavus]
MARNVRIDFDREFNFTEISKDFRIGVFPTELVDGTIVPLKVEIHNEEMELLPNVFNLAFGPIDAKGGIDDRIQLTHKDYSAVFSTIMFEALGYLRDNPDHFIGVDGSNNERAALYHFLLKRNYDYLDPLFEFFGIKYYVRITRFGKTQYENPFDFQDIMPAPVRILKDDPRPNPMFNYFIFGLRNQDQAR